ncbi:vitamin B12 transporter [Chryseobacterium arachidis]|uniref:Vitamin B12 transporter n=1 Tax=Chryseobacterium arachidis TaxID=1416778 RepID=A0A1M5EUU0_9FLAO|nr:TonB-dependent receptor [Chryseobacterium arachidis]SHF83010.1 vitamin B12 transporter [Chryseobacterium arachidis]
MILVGAMLVTGTTIFAQQQETQIEEVTVASKIPQQLYKTGKNVKLFTQEDLQNFKGQTLNDVLDQVAGFQITGNFNNQSEPKSMKIRGGKSANVLVLIDGIPLKDVTGNDYTVTDLRLIALENIESIEVLNGASSVLYGSNATVSVINIKTKQSAQKEVEGILSARGGSFSTFAQNATVKGKINKFNYQVNGFNEKSQGISSAEGDDSFDKDGWEKQNISANAGYTDEKFNVNISGGWNHHLYQYDEGAFADGQYRGNDKQFFTGLNAGFKYNKGQVVFNSRYSGNERIGQSFYTDQYNDQFSYKGKNLFTELYNFYKVNDFFNFTVGVQYENQKMGYSSLPWGGTSLEEVMKEDDTKLSNFDAFAKVNFSYKGLNLDAGTRMTDNSKFGNHWVYSVNPYYLGESGNIFYKIGYSFSTAFIAPTLYQNYGSLPYILPNPDLKPETNQSHEIDLTIGNKSRTLVFNASVFQREEKDVFAYQTVDFVTFAGQYLNVDRNKVKGFEIGFDYDVNKYVGFGGNFSFVEKDEEATMLRQPKQRVNSYLKINPFKSTRIYLTHQFVGKRNDAYYDSMTFSTVNVVNKDFNLFNLNVNQNINKNINISANIGNLFNTSYIDVIGYRTKPRNYTLGVSYQF